MTATAVSSAAPATVGGQASTSGPAASGTVKLTVALPEDAIETVASIAGKQHKTKTQVLREAIALKAFVERELADPNARILVERGGSTREIVFT